ncbi:hypothetical protein R0K19_25710, partial [Bacillus sp. SIMBA_161]
TACDPYYINEIASKSLNKKVTVPIVIFNAHEFIKSLVENLEKQTLFQETLFVFVVADLNVYHEVEAFCTKFPNNSVLVNFMND